MKQEYNLQPLRLWVSEIDILEVNRGKNYGYSYRNGRIKHGFVYVVRGSIRHSFYQNDVSDMVLSSGDLLFVPQGCSYSGEYLEDDTQIRIVQFELSNGTLPDYLSKPVKLELLNARNLIDAFFAMDPASEHQFYYFACMYYLLWQIDESQKGQSSHYIKLRPAINSLKNSSEQMHKIDYYAKLCNMSEGNFRRLFRACVGKTPVEYRNEIRLANAKVLLQSGEYNVSEVAEITGFTNFSFFIRLYKKKYGHTPKQDC